MKRTIYFDMDGTLNRLYDIPDWLPKLRAYDPSPYAEAAVMLNMSLLARYLNKLRRAGYHVAIITWLSKDSTASYSEAVTDAKLEWLRRHLPSVEFDAIHVVNYGTPKHSFVQTELDILFDDNESIRNEWTGEAYTPDQILSVLQKLLREE